MDFSGVNVPLARVWILLSYRDNRDRFSRLWKTLMRTQWILLAFNSLKERKSGSSDITMIVWMMLFQCATLFMDH